VIVNFRAEETSFDLSRIVDEVLCGRRTERGFLDAPVPVDVVKQILSAWRSLQARAIPSRGAVIS
jgi:hypothetical protein